MGELDAPHVHSPLAHPQPPPPMALARMRGQHVAVVPHRRWRPEDDAFARMREEVALLTLLVADQNRLLRDIADHVGRRLDSLERAIDARATVAGAPIELYEGPPRAVREAVTRRHVLGRGLEALIPPRRDP